ncbi:TPA: F0F1 ATP synthase subunit delta [Streptococcus agalactiae]
MNKKTQALIEQYSKSLVEVAIEHKIVEKIQQEVAALIDIFETSELEGVLSSLAVSHDEKQYFVKTLQTSCSTYLVNFLEVIVQNEREALLYPILKSIDQELIKVNGQYPIQITTAVALSPEQKERLFDIAKTKLALPNGQLVEHIDPSIVGGFVVNANNKVIDASVRNQLHQFKMKLK